MLVCMLVNIISNEHNLCYNNNNNNNIDKIGYSECGSGGTYGRVGG